ncbi:hypothetical protein FJ444_07595 [Aestuariibacter sp. GS-14]|uniref:YCF48-related protein n=1 Tax=Aestuariibacter sp. GS-14 TaxID=2590670 RepID=UPI00112CA0BD|nr:YCF48-related protein [Aestuariibacter sp. GS-14]TPV60009.1 hypothetical protein FJ444_07595 [Aestuariibacter sp. GS-14]
MHKLISSVLILVFSLVCQAEQAYQAPLVRESLLLDIESESFAVAVGERGHILIKQGDKEFTQVNVPTQATLTSVTVIGDNIWAAGHDAVIIHSPDRGQSWEIQHNDPDLDRPFLDILFLDALNGIAIGAYGLFYQTQDGGANWESIRHASFLNPMDREYLEEIRKENEDFYQQELESILPHLNRISIASDNTLYLAGEAGLLAFSADNGSTWERFDIEYTGSFFDIQKLENGTVVAAGLRGNIFAMKEGEEWQYLETCNTATINSIIVRTDNVFFIGNNGVVVKSAIPLSLSPHDPFASEDECTVSDGVSITTTESKSALLNAATVQGETIVTAADGIYSLSLD